MSKTEGTTAPDTTATEDANETVETQEKTADENSEDGDESK